MNSQSLVAATCALFLCSVVNGQQETMPKMPEAAQKTPVASQAEVKLTGRLPRNYAAIVNSAQRLEIYRIQADYRSKLEQLRQKIDELKRKELDDIEQVLSKDQLMRVRKLRSTSLRSQVKSQATKSEAVKSTAIEGNASSKPAASK